MKYQNNEFTFSPSDLSNHTNCKSLTFYNKQAAIGKRVKPVYANRITDLLRERGIAFEAEYLKQLEAEGKSILKIEKEDAKPAARTIQGMKDGYDIIYQARLKMDAWHGWADFLIKTDKPSKFGKWSYEVLDTKLATETKAATILQIALYSQMVESIQGVSPEFMHVKTPENKSSYRVDDYLAYVRLVQKRFSTAIQSDEEIYPDVVAHCDLCNWWEECNGRRRADDHLSFIAGMGNLHIKEVRTQSINKLEEMATISLPVPFKPSRGSVETYNKIREQARVQLQSRVEKRPVHELLPREEGLGLYRLAEPNEHDIFLDLEGDPMVEPTGREYIIGWCYKGEYFIEWAETADAEKRAFEKFIDFAVKNKKANPGMHIYHYGPYEVSAFKRLMCRYVTREAEMDSFLRSGTFIDLLSIVRQSLRAGVERYSLKDLERYHGFIREMDLRKLSPVKADYEYLLEIGKSNEATDGMRKIIHDYNKDDCSSTEHLRDWLEALRQQLIDGGEMISRPEPKDGEAGENITAHQERIKPLFDALMKDVPLELSERDEEQQARFILANMLDWYRREDKSFWWEYYHVRELSDEELLDEKKVLTGLEFTGESENIKQSVVNIYKYPEQECEIRVGDKLQDKEKKPLGEVVSINMNEHYIGIKRGLKFKNEHPHNIYASIFFSAKEKEEAILRLSSWVIQNGIKSTDTKFRCGRDLLLRTTPRTKEAFTNNDNCISTAAQWALTLDHSILPIQGPPGTGKSYTASKMIVELVRKKKKIGITALSHKVITNLLQKVYETAAEENVSIRMLQKTSETDLDWDTTNAPADVEAAIENYDVIAGTSFLWPREGLQESVDYLFVDEAGQLSLIDTLSVSQASKNLVMLGDPQQLKQPQQGVHPDGTEVSALEHILQAHQTINSEQGIFLSQTYRMHPDICAFDSELFYDNKLKSIPGLENQCLEGNTKFKGAGLFLQEVNHHGNTSRALEEVDVVESIVNDLCKGDVFWIDKDKNKVRLTYEHIRIIAPYNAQVHELTARIPGVEIGTVDKFQGQEAPVVIFSMTTSSPQDAPRGMEFLYSPNRFNVAVSRACAVFIMVASPALIEAECKSPAQIKLANAFCRFWEVARVNV